MIYLRRNCADINLFSARSCEKGQAGIVQALGLLNLNDIGS